VMRRMDDRAALEGMQEVMRERHSMTVARFNCATCGKAFERRPAMCEAEKHDVRTTRVTVWAFQCGGCRHRILHPHASCATACPKCGEGLKWEAASVHSLKDKLGVEDMAPKLLARGEEQANSLRAQ